MNSIEMRPEILLQFLTVFLGAFLAFWLENLRERRQLKQWVRKYLRRTYKALNEERSSEEASIPVLAQQLSTLEKFSSPETPTLTENDWNSLSNIHYNFQKESVSLLEGEALQVIDASLIKALEQVERLDFACDKLSELYVNAYKDYMMPILLQQPTPPTEVQKQAVAYVRAVGSQYSAHRRKRLEVTLELAQILERHNYHKE
jgi:hypothetical protein